MRALSLLNSSAGMHIRSAPELANTRRLHATEFATTSTITFLELDSATLAASTSLYEAGAKNGSGRLRMEQLSWEFVNTQKNQYDRG